MHLDAGDLFFAPEKIIRSRLDEDFSDQGVSKAELIVDALGAIGLDAFTPGERDLAAGIEVLMALRERSSFPWISANLRGQAGGELLFPSHVLLQRGGMRVAVIGLTDPALLSLLDTPPAADDMAEATRRVVAGLRGEADLLIALAHTTVRGGESLARAVPELDLVCGVHGPDVDRRPGGRKTPTLEVAETSLPRGKALGGRKLYLEGGRDPRTGRFRAAPMPVVMGPELEDEATVRKLIDDYVASLARINTLAESTSAWPVGYEGADTCMSCHVSQGEVWAETPHAHAWQTLVDEGQQHDLECIGCHSAGIDTRALLANPRAVKALGGVQCESCHGPMAGHRENPMGFMGEPVRALTCMRCHKAEHDDAFDFNIDVLLATCVESRNARLHPELLKGQK